MFKETENIIYLPKVSNTFNRLQLKTFDIMKLRIQPAMNKPSSPVFLWTCGLPAHWKESKETAGLNLIVVLLNITLPKDNSVIFHI